MFSTKKINHYEYMQCPCKYKIEKTGIHLSSKQEMSIYNIKIHNTFHFLRKLYLFTSEITWILSYNLINQSLFCLLLFFAVSSLHYWYIFKGKKLRTKKKKEQLELDQDPQINNIKNKKLTGMFYVFCKKEHFVKWESFVLTKRKIHSFT